MDEKKLEMLLKDYEARASEISAATLRLNTQLTLVSSYGAVLAAGVALATALIDPNKGWNTLNIIPFVKDLLTALLVLLFAWAGFNLWASIMDALFIIFLNAARRSQIERDINKCHPDTLIWESRVVEEAYSHMKGPENILHGPPTNILTSSFIIFAFITIIFLGALAFAISMESRWLTILVDGILAVAMLFLSYRWFRLVYKGRKWAQSLVGGLA